MPEIGPLPDEYRFMSADELEDDVQFDIVKAKQRFQEDPNAARLACRLVAGDPAMSRIGTVEDDIWQPESDSFATATGAARRVGWVDTIASIRYTHLAQAVVLPALKWPETLEYPGIYLEALNDFESVTGVHHG